MKPDMKKVFQEKSFAHAAEQKYKISVGFARGKSTRRVDCDAFFWLLKWALDLAVEVTSIIDDSIQYISECRTVVLPPSEDGKEHVYFQITT